MNSDDGSITLWLLGVVLIILALGGLAIDLWRGFAARRGCGGAGRGNVPKRWQGAAGSRGRRITGRTQRAITA